MHSQPRGSTMWGLWQGTATPAYGLSQLVPGCPGARKVLLILPPSSLPSWCPPTCRNRATRATDARNTGTTLGKSTANRKGMGLLLCCVHMDPGEGLREAQGRSGKIKLGTGSFHLWFAWLFGHSGVLHVCCRLSGVFITNTSINSAPGFFCLSLMETIVLVSTGWAELFCLLCGVTWGQLCSLTHENSFFLPHNRIINRLLRVMLWTTLNSLLKSLKLFSNKSRFSLQPLLKSISYTLSWNIYFIAF